MALTRLELTNFRRHEHTEIRFDEAAQIFLIAGKNGSGKSSILESIQFALFGESRHGARKLNSLIRRGAEIEGTQVELEFTKDGTTYFVQRRRTLKMTSAILYGDGHALATSTDGVTAEITKILEMDAAAFRLAVIAQQKELDALADMQPRKRAQMLARLLRLDAIDRAKRSARDQYNQEKAVVQALGAGLDEAAMADEVERTVAAETEARQALEESTSAVAALDAELAGSADVEADYRRAQADLARAEGLLAGTRSQAQRIDGELAVLHVPEPVASSGTALESLYAELSELAREIAVAEQAEQNARTVAAYRRDIGQIDGRIAELAPVLEEGRGADFPAEIAALTAREAELDAIQAALRERRQALLERHGELRALLAQAETQVQRAQTLGGSCDACGQDIPESHRDGHLKDLQASVASLGRDLETVLADGQDVASQMNAAEEESKAVRLMRLERERLAADTLRSVREEAELRQRREHAQAQVDRLDSEPVDLQELQARRGRLECDVAQAKALQEQAAAREAVLAKRAGLEAQRVVVQAEIEQAQAQITAAAIDANLLAAFERRQARQAQRDAEVELMSACAVELAQLAERVKGARELQTRALQDIARRRKHEGAAMTASNAALLLADVETQLTTQVRPALEGAVASLLAVLSDGRFTAVRVDESYSIHVMDDGALRPLEELSGGEQDLVALAVRLALYGVVADRHGSNGAGFLILDECFGSQDPVRRESIMTALRSLRAQYGQILLISHVGGLEDAADAVIEVETQDSEDGRVAVVSV